MENPNFLIAEKNLKNNSGEGVLKRRTVYVLLFLILSGSVFSQDFWERTEPYSGYLNKMSFIGADTIYGTLNSGFTRSTDHGTTWSVPVIVNYVTDMAVAPDGNIYLSENQKKMSRSTNKGVSWTVLPGTEIKETSCSSVMATSSGTVLAGTSSGIYRSTNKGDNWTKVLGAAQTGADSSISAMATSDGYMLYAFSRSNGLYPEKGFAYRSTDDGATWVKGSSSLDSVSIYKAVVHSNGAILVCTGNGVRSSSDGGNTWGAIGFYGSSISDLSTDETGAIVVSINDKKVNGVLFKTTDAGSSWNEISTPFKTGTKFSIHPNGDIFISQDQLYRSTDGGTTWSGLPINFPNVTLMQESPNHELYFTAGGTAYQNLYRSNDFGLSWKPLNTGVVGIPIVGFYGDTILVGDNYYPATIYRSIDNGNSFQSISDISALSGYVNALAGTIYHTIIAGTSNGIYRSIDHGKSWTKVSSNAVTTLQQTPDGTLYGYREFYGTGVYRSTDSGSTWLELKNGMGLTVIHALAIGQSGDLFAGTEGGLFRSTNQGDDWVRIDTQKTAKPYGIYTAVNRDGKIFFGGAKSGTNSDCYESTDNGVTWNAIGSMSTVDNQASLKGLFTSSSGHLFGATGAGLFRSVTITTDVENASVSLPGSFSLLQNFPNPFNPSTVITYEVPKTNPVMIKVYDAIGRETATLVDQIQEAGMHSVTFDASRFAAGVYFYQMVSGNFITAKKMILLK